MRLSVSVRRAVWVPFDIVWGAALFWTPDIVAHAVAPSYAPAIGLFLFSWWLPLLTVVGLELACHQRRETGNRLLTAVAMGIGIWLFGPLCTCLNLNLSGGMFNAKTIAMLTLMAPLSMLDLATYDGTLLALPLGTLLLLISVGVQWRLVKWSRPA